MNEIISIITPVYNSESHLSACIDSIRNQTYTNWEHILIDDFSSDSSVFLIKKLKLKDDRIKLIQLDQNRGAGFARNSGIKEAKGRYIAFLDSDDYWANDKLEKQITFMRKYNYSFSYTDYYEFDDKTGRLKSRVKCPEKVTYKKLLINGGFIGCLTVVYDTNFFGKRYMPEIRKRQDWALWIKMLKDIDCAYGILEPLAFYRTGSASLSRNKIKLVKHNFMVYRKVLKMSYTESTYRMCVFLIYYFLFKSRSKTKLIT